MDLAGLFPKYVDIRRGAYIGLIISMALCPWQLLATADTFLAVLNGFTIFFSPICAIQICDYFIVRQKNLKLSDLYHPRPNGIYYYFHGFNLRTIAAWVLGWAPLIPGLAQTVNPSANFALNKGVEHFYDLNVPYSFLSAFAAYYLITKIFPAPGVGEMDTSDIFGTFGSLEIGSQDSYNSQSPGLGALPICKDDLEKHIETYVTSS